jgi:hypothetical protein
VTDKDLIYARLRRGGGQQLLRYALVRGQGGPLALLWSVGLGLFVVAFGLPLHALVWTLACAALCLLAVLGYAQSPAVHGVVLRALLGRRFRPEELADPDLRAALRQSIDCHAEIALKIAEIERAGGPDHDMRGVLVDADGMLALQLESAQQAEEYERALRLIGRAGAARPDRAAEAAPARLASARLYEENLAAIRREAAAARSMALEISQQIETLMLQVFQMSRRAADIVQTAEVARESELALESIQRQVKARREAASEMLDLVVPRTRGSLSHA